MCLRAESQQSDYTAATDCGNAVAEAVPEVAGTGENQGQDGADNCRHDYHQQSDAGRLGRNRTRSVKAAEASDSGANPDPRRDQELTSVGLWPAL
jgi:hypothetical protein